MAIRTLDSIDHSGKRFVPTKPLLAPPHWQVLDGLTDYEAMHSWMQNRADAIAAAEAPEAVLLLEHPALYTAGTSARPEDLLSPDRFPVHQTGRGGEYTYHGPGQKIGYVMLDLKRRRADVRGFVCALEEWLILTLGMFGVKGERRADRVGVWVVRTDQPALPDGTLREDKIAAIGIRLRRWVSFHGVALNVRPDLDHFAGIVPCGIADHGVTSLIDLGIDASDAEVAAAMRAAFERVFGPVEG